MSLNNCWVGNSRGIRSTELNPLYFYSISSFGIFQMYEDTYRIDSTFGTDSAGTDESLFYAYDNVNDI